MNAIEFKTEVKKVASQLKGLTLQVVNCNSSIPCKSLKQFGEEILKAEANGLGVSVTRVWTNAGAVAVNSFAQLASLLNAGTVTAVQFTARYEANNMVDYLRYSFGTND